ncbi:MULTISPECIES: hypothetical protein [unclassified Sphingomonas]|uniref:hypothetical protein n=1 Tax=unclassified Sphingomonas TaxID=196159 RepID=UPI00226A5316|nr:MULTISPECIES: hypothetical protein [unclassified Sphingomonas]
MKPISYAGLALLSLMPSAAGAQYSVYWSAPVQTNAARSYFPMGTPLRLTSRVELNTKDNHAGDRFYLEVAEPLLYRGQVVVPVGSMAVGEVMRSERNGHFGKSGQLEIRLDYVETPSGPVRISGRLARKGTGQEVLAIGGGVVVAWPMFLIHGTSGRLAADTMVTAYLADDLHFAAQPDAQQAALVRPDATTPPPRVSPARFDPVAFSSPDQR